MSVFFFPFFILDRFYFWRDVKIVRSSSSFRFLFEISIFHTAKILSSLLTVCIGGFVLDIPRWIESLPFFFKEDENPLWLDLDLFSNIRFFSRLSNWNLHSLRFVSIEKKFLFFLCNILAEISIYALRFVWLKRVVLICLWKLGRRCVREKGERKV